MSKIQLRVSQRAARSVELCDLPSDVLAVILRKLSVPDALSCTLVCHKLHRCFVHKRGFDFSPSEVQRKALCHAAKRGDAAYVTAMVRDIGPDHLDPSAYHYALRDAIFEQRKEMTWMLLNTPTNPMGFGCSCVLMYSIKYDWLDVLKHLVEHHGYDPSLEYGGDDSKYPPLVHAIVGGHPDLAEYLWSHEKVVNALNPMHVALVCVCEDAAKAQVMFERGMSAPKIREILLENEISLMVSIAFNRTDFLHRILEATPTLAQKARVQSYVSDCGCHKEVAHLLGITEEEKVQAAHNLWQKAADDRAESTRRRNEAEAQAKQVADAENVRIAEGRRKYGYAGFRLREMERVQLDKMKLTTASEEYIDTRSLFTESFSDSFFLRQQEQEALKTANCLTASEEFILAQNLFGSGADWNYVNDENL